VRHRSSRSRERRSAPPGLALIAPGGKHLSVKSVAGQLIAEVAGGPLVSRHRPSVDVLFESVAQQLGAQAVAALLTGMGDDGARGLHLLKLAGAATLAKTRRRASSSACPRRRSLAARPATSSRSKHVASASFAGLASPALLRSAGLAKAPQSLTLEVLP